MTYALVARIVLAWLAFVPIAVANGALREAVFKRFMPGLAAHQLSTATLSVLFVAVSFFALRNAATSLDGRTLAAIGLAWVAMTVGFEFGIGRFVSGRSWQWLLEDYNLLKGRVWGLFVLVVLASPFIAKALARAFGGAR